MDSAFSGFDLTDRAAYGRFLSAQAAAHLAVETALEAGGVGTVLADWPSRRRGDLLRSDLSALGLPVPPTEALADFDGPAAMLGAVYVLEGSRLGGALLRRSVPADMPRSFLSAGDPAAWRGLLEQLDETIEAPDDVERATNAALRVFTLFELSGKRFLKAD